MTEFVAEISGNHGGRFENAIRLIDEAKEAGADTVKFQCFDASRLALKRAGNPEVKRLAAGEPLVLLYRRTHTPRKWFPDLIKHCQKVDIAWFSSVFDPADVWFLERLKCPRYKISAFEMLDWQLIKAVKETGKPIVMSVRSTPQCQVLHATHYDGSLSALGLSQHGYAYHLGWRPMIEWHLRLHDVDTPDSEFSLTMEQMRERIVDAKRREAA